MKRIFIAFLCLLGLKGFAQYTEGVVEYEILVIDTIAGDTVNYTDSLDLRFTFSFKDDNTKLNMTMPNGTQQWYCNNEETYLLLEENGDKRYVYVEKPDYTIDSLLNYEDTTEMKFVLTSEHRSIKGYYCTKAKMIMTQSGSETTIWYTDQIKGNMLIMGAGITSLNLDGIILEYEAETDTGKRIITAKTVNVSTVSSAIFIPDLTGYLPMD